MKSRISSVHRFTSLFSPLSSVQYQYYFIFSSIFSLSVLFSFSTSQQVQEAEGKQLAADFGAVFYETSAKSSSSIEELFVTLGAFLLYLWIVCIAVWKLFFAWRVLVIVNTLPEDIS